MIDDELDFSRMNKFFRPKRLVKSASGRYAERNIWIPVSALKIGMFVCGLDRSWLETPFSLQGVMVRCLKDIETLRLYCDRVQIDAYKCWIQIDESLLGTNQAIARKPSSRLIDRIRRLGQETDTIEEDSYELAEEIGAAKRIYSESATMLNILMDDIRHGRSLDYNAVKSKSLEMVGSILRNSDALIWLSQLRNKDDYAYQHSINVCILMLTLGKHLALTQDQLVNLAVAGLLQDIGVLLLPKELLHKQGKLADDEMALAKSHVDKSLDLLQYQKGISGTVLETIAHHHERYDGSGYPKGLRASEISLYGGIAGIADCYDAMISERPYSTAIPSFQALMVLYELKGAAFSSAVVERFIQSIGIYPIGSVVELNSGEVAIVIEQRRERRLKPRLLVVLDTEKQPYQMPFDLDLIDDPLGPNQRPYSIRDVLGSGAHGIDPAEYFLV